MSRQSFIDYYEVLQVSPHAAPDTIQRVYRLLAQHYHPDNKETGSEEAFKEVLAAYRILSDPERRAAYDIEHRMARKLWRIFETPNAIQGFEGEKRKRHGILSALYTKRLRDPEQPGMSMREIEELLGCPREHLEFSFWYLKENQWIQRGDNGRHVITAKGVDVAEANGQTLVPENRMLTGPVQGPQPVRWAAATQA